MYASSGSKFGNWSILDNADCPESKIRAECVCGFIQLFRASRIVQGRAAKSCSQHRTGVFMKSGTKVARWTLLQDAQTAHSVVLCECECGIRRTVDANTVKRGLSKSCGCYERDTARVVRSRTLGEVAWNEFKNRVSVLGGRVVEPEWLGAIKPHRVICNNGHYATAIPNSVQGGQGICRFCRGKIWDCFYIVFNPSAEVCKFGVTSGDPRPRLNDHRINGFTEVIAIYPNIMDAYRIERETLATLRTLGYHPIYGREYFSFPDDRELITEIADSLITGGIPR